MYTIDDENNNEYEEEYYENSFWDNNKGLIIKIIIIILCVIVLIWLFKALNTKRNASNNTTHVTNVEKMRLAAEDYFFIQNNKGDNKTVNLSTLKSAGLIDELVDANNKTCNVSSTNATLSKEIDGYKMTVKLDCSTIDKEEKFYYHNNTLACLNCNGKTKMTGQNSVEIKEEVNGGNKDDSNIVSVNNDKYNEYSCVNWSDWTKTRVYDSSLEERSKTLVQGVKYNSDPKVIYSDWSEYTTTPIIARDDLEVEIKNVIENVWSDTKTASDISTSNNIRILDTRVVEDDTCSNGFVENNICYSNRVKVGNLTFKEYNSGNYKIQKNYCEGVKTLRNSEGKYVLTYINCKYNEAIDMNDDYDSSYIVYDYQELEQVDVTYYRSRSVTTVNEQTDPVYTQDKYEEKYLPEGYVKVEGSEETYYSYKYPVCEK